MFMNHADFSCMIFVAQNVQIPPPAPPPPPLAGKKKEKSYTAEGIVLTRFGSNILHIKIDEIYTFFGLSIVEMF